MQKISLNCHLDQWSYHYGNSICLLLMCRHVFTDIQIFFCQEQLHVCMSKVTLIYKTLLQIPVSLGLEITPHHSVASSTKEPVGKVQTTNLHHAAFQQFLLLVLNVIKQF